MLISPEYLALQRELHARNIGYGAEGAKRAPDVIGLARSIGARSILDYGAGRASLGQVVKLAMPEIEWHNYDPAIDAFANDPVVCDLVVSTDMLEHAELSCLDAVLDHIAALARRAVYLLIATRPAVKTLADGRNAHLIVEPLSWWAPKLEARWSMQQVIGSPNKIIYVGVSK